MKIHSRRAARALAALALLTTTVLGGLVPVASAGAAPAPAHLPFLPILVDDLGPVGTQGTSAAWLAISGNWVAYATTTPSCGHCSQPVNIIYLKDVLTGRKITVKTAILLPQSSDGYAQGAQHLQFACPACSTSATGAPVLVWEQPAPQPPAQYEAYVAGDYTCTRCSYDLGSGHGGAYAGGDLPPDPPGFYKASHQGADGLTPDTVVVTDTSANREVIRAPLPAGAHVALIAAGADKVLFAQTEWTAPYGLEGNPELIRLPGFCLTTRTRRLPTSGSRPTGPSRRARRRAPGCGARPRASPASRPTARARAASTSCSITTRAAWS